MEMRNNDVISTIIKLKFGVADRVISILPDDLWSKVTELRTEVFSCLQDELAIYVEKGKEGIDSPKIRKVELD